MLKSISILILMALILQVFVYGQASISSTNGPFTNDVTSYLAYDDSLVFLFKKDFGLFKSTNAGNSWYRVLNGIPKNENIISMTRHRYGNLFAAITSGGVLRSTDNGESWVLESSSQLGVVKLLFGTTNGFIFAATEDLRLFRTNNAGYNWALLHSDYDVYSMAESTLKYLFINKSTWIYRSVNNGLSWESLDWWGYYNDILASDNFYAVYIVGHPYIYRSIDQGDNWQNLSWGPSHTSLVVTTDSIIFASMNGSSGIVKSTNYGSTFSYYAMYGANVQKMFMLDDQFIFVYRTEGVFRNNFRISNQFIQVDKDIELPDITNLTNIHAIVTSLVAITDSAGLLRYNGTSWSRLYKEFPINTDISSVYVASNFQLIGTKNDGLWRSSDNGINWTHLNVFPQLNSEIVEIRSSNSVLIYCATKNDGIFSTTDGGINWQSSNTGLPATFVIEDMEVTKSGLCYLSLLNDGVYFSLDSGNTWYPRNIGLPSNTTIISLASRGNFLLGTTQSNGIYLSSNFGESWFSVSAGLPSTLFNPIVKYHSSGMAYLANERTIYKSNDFGVNWVPNYTVPQGVKILSLEFDPNSILYLGCDNGSVYKSTYSVIPVELSSFVALKNNNNVELIWSTATELNNRGFEIERSIDNNEWRIIGYREGNGTTSEPQQYSYSDDISEITASKLYYRLKQIDFNGSFEYSDIVEVEITPLEFSLSQNYPNPFNPNTTISWQSPVASWQTIKLYNALGQEVDTIVDEYLPAGFHSKLYIVNSTLPSGVYFYQLKAGNYLETKKMMVVK